MTGPAGVIAEDAATTRAPLRDAGRTIVELVTRVLVDPVREGFVRDSGWPRGLAPVAIVAYAGIAVAITLTLAAGALRESFPLAAGTGALDVVLPRAVLWVVFALVGLSLALVQSGAIHAAPWLRWTITVVIVLTIQLAALPDTSLVARAVSLAAAAGIVALVAIRGRRAWAWWEFPVVAAIVYAALVVDVAVIAGSSRALGFDFAPVILSLLLATLALFAIPTIMAAGAGVAELASSTALWGVAVLRERFGRIAVGIVFVLAIAWRGIDIGGWIADPERPLEERLASLAVVLATIAIAGGLWALVVRLRAASGHSGVADLLSTSGTVAIAVAAVTHPVILSSVVQMAALVAQFTGVPLAALEWASALQDAMSTSFAISAARAAGGVLLIALALVLARRGSRTTPEFLVVAALMNIAIGLAGVTGVDAFNWSSATVSLAATLVPLAAIAWLLVRRSLTAVCFAALTVAVLAAALFAHRDVLADPLAAIVGTSTIAVVLFGQVWNLISGNAIANASSARYPFGARVPLVLGFSLFGFAVLATATLARDPSAIIDLGGFGVAGMRVFGDAILIATLLIALSATRRGTELH